MLILEYPPQSGLISKIGVDDSAPVSLRKFLTQDKLQGCLHLTRSFFMPQWLPVFLLLLKQDEVCRKERNLYGSIFCPHIVVQIIKLIFCEGKKYFKIFINDDCFD